MKGRRKGSAKKIIYFIVALVLVVSFGSIVIQPQAVTKGGVSVDYTKEKVGDMSGNLYTINKDEVTTYGWPWTAITKTVKNILLLLQSQIQFITKSILMVNGIMAN